MMTNCNFIEQDDGLLTINPNISIRICDFSAAEVFKKADFDCHKRKSIYKGPFAPEILWDNKAYNARKADIWSLGLILFECMTGKALKTVNNNWIGYLQTNKRLKYFDSTIITLLCHLLDPNALTRYSAEDIIKDKWFDAYFTTYNYRISMKSFFQTRALLEQSNKMAIFPYYGHEFSIDIHGS